MGVGVRVFDADTGGVRDGLSDGAPTLLEADGEAVPVLVPVLVGEGVKVGLVEDVGRAEGETEGEAPVERVGDGVDDRVRVGLGVGVCVAGGDPVAVEVRVPVPVAVGVGAAVTLPEMEIVGVQEGEAPVDKEEVGENEAVDEDVGGSL